MPSIATLKGKRYQCVLYTVATGGGSTNYTM